MKTTSTSLIQLTADKSISNNTMTPPPSAAGAITAPNDSEEERSLLFSDSEQESSHAGDMSKNNDHTSNDLQWEDFMITYWNHDSTNDTDGNDEFQIADNADEIVMREDTDMSPRALEPELDIPIYFDESDQLKDKDIMTNNIINSSAANDNNDELALIKLLSKAGIQSAIQMAQLSEFDRQYSKSSRMKKEVQRKKKQLQDEFVIDMTDIPLSSATSKRKKMSRVNATNNITATAATTKQMEQLQINPELLTPGTTRSSHYDQQSLSSTMVVPPASSPLQQQEESLEDSLVAMAQRLSPGNDVSQQQHYEQHQRPQQQQQQVEVEHQQEYQQHLLPTEHLSDSPLPNPNLIHQMGPIQTRTSLRSLLMKKWHASWWMHYDTHSLLIFRSKDHLDDWVQNPYHGKRERAYLVKLRVDFADIVGGGGASTANTSSSGSGDGNSKEGILGHRILSVKKKSYNKNEPEMYQFKLERWTNMGVSVLAAFASEEEGDVQLLYDTIVKIMSTCPFGGLHNIDHMLQH